MKVRFLPIFARRLNRLDPKLRIVFSYLSKNEVVLLAIGDHAAYE